ncbi:hypothetical protein E2C01_046401 [Portunus trituberculatus]|uniref:Uncharacterized protein n=1 Tax=Portunus trituberculatus TaxID=210409 RepID=A0A5B7FXT0_PORTR|nr:hypothetical protein [Portunus trituberculatus]
MQTSPMLALRSELSASERSKLLQGSPGSPRKRSQVLENVPGENCVRSNVKERTSAGERRGPNKWKVKRKRRRKVFGEDSRK